MYTYELISEVFWPIIIFQHCQDPPHTISFSNRLKSENRNFEKLSKNLGLNSGRISFLSLLNITVCSMRIEKENRNKTFLHLSYWPSQFVFWKTF